MFGLGVRFIAAGGREFAVTPAANPATVTYPLDPYTTELCRSLRSTKNGMTAWFSLPGAASEGSAGRQGQARFG
jgi:hypothetical protein